MRKEAGEYDDEGGEERRGVDDAEESEGMRDEEGWMGEWRGRWEGVGKGVGKGVGVCEVFTVDDNVLDVQSIVRKHKCERCSK